MVDRICETCGSEFKVKPYKVRDGKGRFCSKYCYDYPRRKIETICPQCGEKFLIHPYKVKDGVGKYCSNECAYLSKKIYVEGQKFLRSSRRRARRLAMRVFKNECVICGGDPEHCHHKNCDPSDNLITNLALLCIPCHESVHREIERAG